MKQIWDDERFERCAEQDRHRAHDHEMDSVQPGADEDPRTGPGMNVGWGRFIENGDDNDANED